jgi:hypothetical protein
MPITGELWTSLYTGDATRIRKWLYGSVLIRDWAADGSTSFAGVTPFNTDGSIKNTLLSSSFPGGRFYELGAISEAGVEFTPKFATDDTKIWQDRRAQRSDITQDDEEVMFTAMQSTPLVDVLRANLPLTALAGQEVGEIGYQITKPLTTDTVWRQIVVIGVDGTQSNAEYIAEMRPRVNLLKVGKRTFAAKSVDSTELTYGVFPDPASGFSANTLRSGPSWIASGGPVLWPTPQVAPVVSGLASGGKGTITLAQPVSLNDPFTYTVKLDGTTTATLDTTYPSAGGVGYQTVSGTVTIKVTGVSAGSHTVQVIATGSNGSVSAPSTASSSATFLA